MDPDCSTILILYALPCLFFLSTSLIELANIDPGVAGTNRTDRYGALFLLNIGVFKARQQGGPKRIFLLICFDDHSNLVPTNGKSVPTKLLLNLPGGAVAPPGPLGKYAYGF